MRNTTIMSAVISMASGLLLASACGPSDGLPQDTEDGVEGVQNDDTDEGSTALSAMGRRFGRGHNKSDSGAGGSTGTGGTSGTGGVVGSTGGAAGSGGSVGGSGGTSGSVGGSGGTSGSVGGSGGSSGSVGGSGGTSGSVGGSGGTSGSVGGSGGTSGSVGGSGGTSGAAGSSGAGAGNGGSAGSASGCATQPAAVPGASGKSKVVALNGNDTTGDGSLAKPLRTLKKACSVAQPGDAVEVRGGTYNTAGETCSAKGTVDHPIHVRPYAGEKVLFEAGGHALSKSVSVIELTNASYVVLDGFEVANSSGRGVFAYECVGATMRNLRVHDTGYRGIGGTGQDLVFENNEVWNVVLANTNSAMGTGGWPAAVATYSRANGTPSKNVVVRNNYIHDSWGECVIALFADGMTIEGNRLQDCFSVSLYVDNSRDVRIERNQIWVTTEKYNKKGYPSDGIMFSTESYSSGEPQQRIENLVIANNVVTDTNRGIHYWHGSSTAAYNTWVGVSVLHNVVRNTKGAALSFEGTGSAPAPSGGVLANNVIWAGSGGTALETGNPGAWQIAGNDWPSGKPAADKSASSISVNPGMVAPGSASSPEGFRLAPNSPCDDKGVAAPLVTSDFWCAPRNATSPSIGVHEP